MAKKVKFFEPENLVRSFKGIAANIVALLISAIPTGIGMWLINVQEMMVFGRVFQVLGLFVFLFAWGFLVKKWWKWK